MPFDPTDFLPRSRRGQPRLDRQISIALTPDRRQLVRDLAEMAGLLTDRRISDAQIIRGLIDRGLQVDGAPLDAELLTLEHAKLLAHWHDYARGRERQPVQAVANPAIAKWVLDIIGGAMPAMTGADVIHAELDEEAEDLEGLLGIEASS